MSLLGLLAFPLGTLVNIYVLWLLNCNKGRYILSPEYRQVVTETPHVKHKSTPIAWALLIILAIIMLFMFTGIALV